MHVHIWYRIKGSMGEENKAAFHNLTPKDSELDSGEGDHRDESVCVTDTGTLKKEMEFYPSTAEDHCIQYTWSCCKTSCKQFIKSSSKSKA